MDGLVFLYVSEFLSVYEWLYKCVSYVCLCAYRICVYLRVYSIKASNKNIQQEQFIHYSYRNPQWLPCRVRNANDFANHAPEPPDPRLQPCYTSRALYVLSASYLPPAQIATLHKRPYHACNQVSHSTLSSEMVCHLLRRGSEATYLPLPTKQAWFINTLISAKGHPLLLIWINMFYDRYWWLQYRGGGERRAE